MKRLFRVISMVLIFAMFAVNYASIAEAGVGGTSDKGGAKIFYCYSSNTYERSATVSMKITDVNWRGYATAGTLTFLTEGRANYNGTIYRIPANTVMDFKFDGNDKIKISFQIPATDFDKYRKVYGKDPGYTVTLTGKVHYQSGKEKGYCFIQKIDCLGKGFYFKDR